MDTRDALKDSGKEVAVIGIAGRFPGADNPRELWSNLKSRYCGITRWSVDELAQDSPVDRDHPNFVPAGAVLEKIDQFDHRAFNYTAADAVMLDPQQRLFLQVAVEAFEDAGYDWQQYPGLIGVYAGAAENQYF